MENKGFDIALLEKNECKGLTAEEVIELASFTKKQFYPIELEAKMVESTAMGFITRDAAEKLEFDYESSGLRDFISLIMDDMKNEKDNFTYTFRGLKIYFSR